MIHDISNLPQSKQVYQIMEQGGFFDAISEHPELERVRRFVQQLNHSKQNRKADTLLYPRYWPLEGLSTKPFLDLEMADAITILEKNHKTIQSELANQSNASFSKYRPAPKGWLAPLAKFLIRHYFKLDWSLIPLIYMGEETLFAEAFPKTMNIIKSIEGLANSYPWADVVISRLQAGARIPPHCSIDNLRVRLHLTLESEPGAYLKVADQKHYWETGKCFAFDDGFQHEAVNCTAKERTVLIVDLWKPNLTTMERHALTQGFRHPQIRQLLAAERLQQTHLPDIFVSDIQKKLHTQNQPDEARQYWPRFRAADHHSETPSH